MSIASARLRRLTHIRWGIYLLLAAAVIVPYFAPIQMKFQPGESVVRLYRQVDALPRGSHVLISLDYDPGGAAELSPMGKVMVEHCFRNGLVPVVMTHWISGLGISDALTREAAADAHKWWGKELLPGRDYVYLGYRPGQSNLVLNMGENLKVAFDKDYEGRPTRDMAALAGVNSLKDFAMILEVTAGTPGAEMWIMYGTDRLKIPLGVGSTAVMVPDLIPFLQAGQMVGMLGGLRGAADYETLLDLPKAARREATLGMVSQSAAHTLVILLILGANAGVVLRRLWRRRRGAA